MPTALTIQMRLRVSLVPRRKYFVFSFLLVNFFRFRTRGRFVIQDLLDPTFLQRQQRIMAAQMESEAARLDAGSPSAVEMSEYYRIGSQELRAMGAMLSQAGVSPRDDDQLAYIPRDPFLSILQASLDESYSNAGAVETVKPAGFAFDQRQFVPAGELQLQPAFATAAAIDKFVAFQEGDPRYGSMYLSAEGYRFLNGKHGFKSDLPKVQIGKNARVVLFGDWGSGIPRAQALARTVKEQIAAAPSGEGHAVHLGDVYYAGFEWEYQKRVMPYWPGTKDRSWSISGNHDMYAGGTGFFNVLLADPRFALQQNASWFLLENDDWQIFGLDSSWAPPDISGMAGDFYGMQADVLHKIRSENRHKGGILLTHHQPFSAFGDTDSPKMVEKLAPTLNEGLLRAWFWGHEHRCAVYKPWRNVVYPCLTGNAGIPVPWKNSSVPASVRWQWSDSKDVGGKKFATMGCVVLDFTANKVMVTFHNEDGDEVVPEGSPHFFTKA